LRKMVCAAKPRPPCAARPLAVLNHEKHEKHEPKRGELETAGPIAPIAPGVGQLVELHIDISEALLDTTSSASDGELGGPCR